MKFIDEARIYVKAGDGGNGCVSFSRNKFNPRGGPDGGNGGKGGDIIFKSTNSKHSLLDFQFQSEYVAESGRHGGKNNLTGADGKDMVISVPAGSVIKNAKTGELFVDLNEAGKTAIVLYGGIGGKGNAMFATPSRQSPDFALEPGKGEKAEIQIELKLLADVGIVGMPNAGKSTLISRISAAKPKIADYPFTTLVPNLGVVKYHDADFVVADVPGLIEGAHLGTGLGVKFLKHVERTKVLLHMIDVTGISGDPLKNMEIINNELKSYSSEVGRKPMLYVLNKIDAKDEKGYNTVVNYLNSNKIEYVEISCATGAGLENLLNRTYKLIQGEDE
jgi:GTPase